MLSFLNAPVLRSATGAILVALLVVAGMLLGSRLLGTEPSAGVTAAMATAAAVVYLVARRNARPST